MNNFAQTVIELYHTELYFKLIIFMAGQVFVALFSKFTRPQTLLQSFKQ